MVFAARRNVCMLVCSTSWQIFFHSERSQGIQGHYFIKLVILNWVHSRNESATLNFRGGVTRNKNNYISNAPRHPNKSIYIFMALLILNPGHCCCAKATVPWTYRWNCPTCEKSMFCLLYCMKCLSIHADIEKLSLCDVTNLTNFSLRFVGCLSLPCWHHIVATLFLSPFWSFWLETANRWLNMLIPAD